MFIIFVTSMKLLVLHNYTDHYNNTKIVFDSRGVVSAMSKEFHCKKFFEIWEKLSMKFPIPRLWSR